MPKKFCYLILSLNVLSVQIQCYLTFIQFSFFSFFIKFNHLIKTWGKMKQTFKVLLNNFWMQEPAISLEYRIISIRNFFILVNTLYSPTISNPEYQQEQTSSSASQSEPSNSVVHSQASNNDFQTLHFNPIPIETDNGG